MAWHRIPQLLDRLESRIALLSLVWKGATVVAAGAATGWIAYITDWIAAYGPIGWWSAALLGTLVASLIMWIFAAIRYAWIHATAKDRWSKVVDKVNPLSHKFDSQRILFSDLAHPIWGKIKNNSFIDCDLIGPANIGM